MNRWFRFYTDAIEDPKVQRLPAQLFKSWVNVLCLASKHDGVLPPVDDMAFALRCSENAAKELINDLLACGLLDETDEGYKPHNWAGRQFKSDITDPTNAVRQKRWRNRNRNGNSVTPKRPDSDSEQNRIVEGEHARAREPARSLISPDAIALAEEIAVIAGIGPPADWPPGWCGAPLRVQAMLSNGWHPEIMLAEARATMGRKRDHGPPDGIGFFEKPFARAHARQAAPLPVVEISKNPEVIHETTRRGRGNGSAITAAIDAHIEAFERAARDEREEREAPAGLLPDR